MDKGIPEDEEDPKLKKTRKKDAKPLFAIQQSLRPTLFSRIAATNTTNEAWGTLKSEFQGNPKIMAVKMQTLRQAFEK